MSFSGAETSDPTSRDRATPGNPGTTVPRNRGIPFQMTGMLPGYGARTSTTASGANASSSSGAGQAGASVPRGGSTIPRNSGIPFTMVGGPLGALSAPAASARVAAASAVPAAGRVNPPANTVSGSAPAAAASSSSSSSSRPLGPAGVPRNRGYAFNVASMTGVLAGGSTSRPLGSSAAVVAAPAAISSTDEMMVDADTDADADTELGDAAVPSPIFPPAPPPSPSSFPPGSGGAAAPSPFFLPPPPSPPSPVFGAAAPAAAAAPVTGRLGLCEQLLASSIKSPGSIEPGHLIRALAQKHKVVSARRALGLDAFGRVKPTMLAKKGGLVKAMTVRCPAPIARRPMVRRTRVLAPRRVPRFPSPLAWQGMGVPVETSSPRRGAERDAGWNEQSSSWVVPSMTTASAAAPPPRPAPCSPTGSCGPQAAPPAAAATAPAGPQSCEGASQSRPLEYRQPMRQKRTPTASRRLASSSVAVEMELDHDDDSDMDDDDHDVDDDDFATSPAGRVEVGDGAGPVRSQCIDEACCWRDPAVYPCRPELDCMVCSVTEGLERLGLEADGDVEMMDVGDDCGDTAMGGQRSDRDEGYRSQ
ncbi:MAG: hypothetical protein M1825_000340 [Sarcosagium campestre]|nr:MAG: hypothetical protein M1825_000340 [Sarcosagium campestre]